MRFEIWTNHFLKTLLMCIFALHSFFAWSAEPVNIPPPPPPPNSSNDGFLEYKSSSDERSDTYRLLNKQDEPNQNMNTSAKNYEGGKTRAEQMVSLLQNKELTKAFQKITVNGAKTLEENPEIGNPLGIIVGAASLWYGRTLGLIKTEDIKFSAKLEAKARRSEFLMTSPLMNGTLNFDANQGIGLGFNRKISSIQTDTAILYNARSQVFSTEVRKKLSPNIDLTFGASRLDQSTKIEYNINF